MRKSFEKSHSNYDVKIELIMDYYDAFPAYVLEEILIIMQKTIDSNNPRYNPFLLVLNPIKTALLLIELIRKI